MASLQMNVESEALLQDDKDISQMDLFIRSFSIINVRILDIFIDMNFLIFYCHGKFK